MDTNEHEAGGPASIMNTLKKLFGMAFVAMVGSSVTLGATVIFQFQDNFGRMTTPAVSLTPGSVPLIQSNTIVLSGMATFRWPTNGLAIDSWGNTNFWGWTNGQLVLPLSAGGYTVQVQGWPRSWGMTVPSSTNIFYASDLSSNTLILQPMPNYFQAGILSNAVPSSSPGVSVVNGVITISTNYDALGSATAAVANRAKYIAASGGVWTLFDPTGVIPLLGSADLAWLQVYENVNVNTNGYVFLPGNNMTVTYTTNAFGIVTVTYGTTTTPTLSALNVNGLAQVGSLSAPASPVTTASVSNNLPAFTGDFTSPVGSPVATMKNTGTAGTYPVVTTDPQGRVTSGRSLTVNDLPPQATTNNGNYGDQPGTYQLWNDISGGQNPPPYGQPWAAMQKPWKVLYVAGYGATPEGESFITNMLAKCQAIPGLMNAWTNQTIGAVYLDGAWMGPRFGITNAANDITFYNYRHFGNQTWNTTLYPHGMEWVCAMLHSNGLKVIVQVYGCTNITPSGADEYICDFTGSHFQLHTNGTGAWPADGNGNPYSVCSSRDTARHDVSQYAAAGIDGFCLADGTPLNFQEADSIWGNASMRVWVPVGWNNNPQYPGYFNVNTNLFSFQSPINWQEYNAAFMMGHPQMYMAFQSPNGNQAFTVGYQQAGGHSAVYYDNTGQGAGAAGLRSIARDFPSTLKANQGAYVSWMGVDDTPSVVATALSHGLLFDAYLTEEVIGSGWGNWTNAMLNTNFIAVCDDPNQNMPTKLVDYGAGIGSVWATKLFNGNYAVGFFNESNTGTTNITLNWSSLGWPSNLAVHVYDRLDGTDRGTNYGSYTQGFSAGSAMLFGFDPVAPLQQSQPLINNLVGSGPINVTLTTNGTSVTGTIGQTIGSGYPNYVVVNDFNRNVNGNFVAVQIPQTVYPGAADWFDYGYTLNNSTVGNFQPPAVNVYGNVQGTNLVQSWLFLSTNAATINFTPIFNFLLNGTNIDARFVGVTSSNSFTFASGTNLTWVTWTNALNPFPPANTPGTSGYYSPAVPLTVGFSFTNASQLQIYGAGGTFSASVFPKMAVFKFQ